MNFWFQNPVTASANDYLQVSIDNNVLWTYPGDPNTSLQQYTLESIDISQFADGGSHVLEFYSETFEASPTNFFVDDVSISAVPVPAAAWLFGSGLLGLAGISRRKKAA